MGWLFVENLVGRCEGPGTLGTTDPTARVSNPFIAGGLDLFSLLLSPCKTDGMDSGAPTLPCPSLQPVVHLEAIYTDYAVPTPFILRRIL